VTGPPGLRRFVPGAGTGAPPASPATGPRGSGPEPPPESRAGGAAPPVPPLVQAVTAAAQPGAPPRRAPQPAAGQPEAEACEMCAAAIPAEHGHVADLEAASLLCACRACYLLFTQSQAARGRYRSVPDRYLCDPERPVQAAEWDALDIPVGLAFFLRSSQRGEVTAFYPSPAGATECRLDLAAWDRLAQAHPLLAAIAPDVEAALITRRDDGSIEHFLVPIDACYELAGRMRLLWRGFDGGGEARDSMAEFLGIVRSRARPLRQEA
jgi:uncharacterized protein DUF5947